MLWHNNLAAAVATRLFVTNWQTCRSDTFDITARSKTLDTLVQKLRREDHLSLDEVQDLAGVRVLTGAQDEHDGGTGGEDGGMK